MCGKIHQSYKSKFFVRNYLKASNFTIVTALTEQKIKQQGIEMHFSSFLCMFSQHRKTE